MFGGMLFSEGKQRRNGSEGGEGMGGAQRGEERGKCGLDLLNERSIYSQLQKIILLKIWNIMLQLYHCFVHVQKNPKGLNTEIYA